MEVEYLKWDSEFFKEKIGRCNVNTYSDFLKQDRKTFDLVYVFSTERIEELEMMLKDEKCLLSCELEEDIVLEDLDITIESFNPSKHSYEELLALVYESGIHSRFKIDTNFRSTAFKDLYKKWLDNSLSGEYALDTLVALNEGEIMGFLTFNNTDEETVSITLTAVDSKFRGKKVATGLIQAFKDHARLAGYKKASVVTQFTNEPAMHLYQKNLFKINSITYIYHIWNHDTV